MVNDLNGNRNGADETAFERAGAFNAYVQQNLTQIKSILAGHISSKLSASVSDEDLLHDLFLKALQCRETFDYRDKASFLQWMSVLANGVACRTARGHARAPRTLSIRKNGASEGASENAVPPSHIPGQTRTPSSIVAGDERCRYFREVLKSLPQTDRDVIRIVKLEERSLEEAAAVMGCSSNAVSKRLTRATRRLGRDLPSGLL